jgi:hypothetical protein
MKKLFIGIKNFIKQFFYSNGKPSPPYVWITLACGYVMFSCSYYIWFIIKNNQNVSETFIISLFGFIAGWLVIYNVTKKKDI